MEDRTISFESFEEIKDHFDGFFRELEKQASSYDELHTRMSAEGANFPNDLKSEIEDLARALTEARHRAQGAALRAEEQLMNIPDFSKI